MTDVKVSETVAAPAAKVWELLGDFGGVTKWGGAMMQSCKVEGEGVGAVRRIGLPGGMEIAERCESLRRGEALALVLDHWQEPHPDQELPVGVHGRRDRPEHVSRRLERDASSPTASPRSRRRAWCSGIYTGGIAGVRKLLGV